MTYYVNPKGQIATRGKPRNITYVEIWTEHMQPKWWCGGKPEKAYMTPEHIERIIKEEQWKKLDMRTAKKIMEGAKQIELLQN